MAKKYDHSGSGRARMLLTTAAMILQRSPSTIRRWLRTAKKSGLIREYFIGKDNWITVYYSSIKKAAAAAGLEEIGPMAEIHLSELKYLRIYATDIEAEHLQNQAYYALKHGTTETDRHGARLKSVKAHKSLVDPISILSPSVKPSGVLAKVGRFTMVSEDFTPWGGSQDTLAARRGVSVRTIQRHLSNEYRLGSTPILSRKRAIYSIDKTQILQQLPSDQQFKARIAQELYPEESQFLIEYGGRYFLPRCNIYHSAFASELRSKTYLRREYKALIQSLGQSHSVIDKNFLCSENCEPPDFLYKFCLWIRLLPVLKEYFLMFFWYLVNTVYC